MSALEESLTSIRARPPRWVVEAALPSLRLHPPGADVLSDAARRGLLADLKSEGPDSIAEHARAAVPALEPGDCAALMRALLLQWAEAGAPRADQRWLLFAVGLLGDEPLLEDLGRRVGADHAARRHQHAKSSLDALFRNGGPVARRWLAHWARRAPGLSLRASAWAAHRALTRTHTHAEVQVPDLGFDARGEQTHDHAGRTLRLWLTAEGELSIADGDRPLRALPAARRQDDPEAVRASRSRLQQLRATLQETTAILHDALEEAMILGQPLAQWQAALRSPLAYRASRGLVLEAHDDTDASLGRFFFSDELEALDRHGSPISLEAAAAVRVVHPVAMSPEERAEWRQILEEARALQPLAQLSRAVQLRPAGPAPLAHVLASLPSLGTARLARGLAARGYLSDTGGGALMVERALRFLGPYLVVVSHEPMSLNPSQWGGHRTHRITAVEIRRGDQLVPAERVQPAIYSEIVEALRAL